jgi:hypothetical protein
MPVHRPTRPIASTSTARKAMGFSINDIIRSDESAASILKTSPRHHPPATIPAYLPQTAWLPPPPLPPSNLDPLVQYQLQYLRHSGRLFDGRFASQYCS